MSAFVSRVRSMFRSSTAQTTNQKSPVRIESLESRQLLSSTYASQLLDLTAQQAPTVSNIIVNALSTSTVTTTAVATPALPIVRRSYLGDAFDQQHVKLALVIKIRKQENRGSYASLRGDIRLAIPSPIHIFFTSITYGKLRSNLHIDFRFSGNEISGTISGKVFPSGSQIKGVYSVSGMSVTGPYKSSGTFKVNKVVGIG